LEDVRSALVANRELQLGTDSRDCRYETSSLNALL